MKCFIYRNLNRKGVAYSFKALEGPFKGRVVAYGDSFFVNEAEFRVSQSGWQRAVRDKKRNVHAGIVGKVVAVENYVERLPNKIRATTVWDLRDSIRVRYHPFQTKGSFVVQKRGRELPVKKAGRVSARKNVIRAIDVT